MKRWEKENVMKSHLQEHQVWNMCVLLKMGIEVYGCYQYDRNF